MMVPPELIADALAACQAELDKANEEIVLLRAELETLKDSINEMLADIEAAMVPVYNMLRPDADEAPH